MIPLIAGLEIIEDRDTESDTDSIRGESFAEQEVHSLAEVVRKRAGRERIY